MKLHRLESFPRFGQSIYTLALAGVIASPEDLLLPDADGSTETGHSRDQRKLFRGYRQRLIDGQSAASESNFLWRQIYTGISASSAHAFGADVPTNSTSCQ